MKKSCNNVMAVCVVILLIISGCGGRSANPVMVTQYGDQKKSCLALQTDLSYTESEIRRLMPDTEKTGKNVALGVTGAFLIVPLFFMDFSDAEKIEVNALRQRHNYLAILAGEKNCGYEIAQIPDFKKPKEEEKKEDDLFKED
jgi:hypothetical protein